MKVIGWYWGRGGGERRWSYKGYKGHGEGGGGKKANLSFFRLPHAIYQLSFIYLFNSLSFWKQPAFSSFFLPTLIFISYSCVASVLNKHLLKEGERKRERGRERKKLEIQSQSSKLDPTSSNGLHKEKHPHKETKHTHNSFTVKISFAICNLQFAICMH